MKKKFQIIFQTINILSLDVVAGSIMTGIFACKVLDVELDFWWILILALAVWVMYSTDHLLDAWRGKTLATIKRHRFHYHNRQIILPIWFIAAATCIVLSFLMLERDILFLGMLIGIGILLYFGAIYFANKKRPLLLQKELFIAVIYIAGIWLAPLVWHGENPNDMIWMLISNLVLLAWSEGILISWFEFDKDTIDQHTSFSILFGKKASRRFVYFLLLLVFAFSISGILIIGDSMLFRIAFAIELMMGIVLIVLISFSNVFDKNELYRYVGEASFLLPGLILLF
ncbi:MAG: hypothetical protein KQH67_04055 [Bacteroidetes bacterium]|nr:hypothetical protein [Bacteroidota bacterium]